MKKTLFSIHLIQDDDHISVISEAAGGHPDVYDLGIEIMANLAAASKINPEMNIRVAPLTYTDHMQ